MPSLVIDRADLFPVGTTVDARAGTASSITADALVGAIIESQAVGSDGKATFTTLVDGSPYLLTATVGGEARRLLVRKASTFTAGATWKATVAARRTAIGTS